MTDFTVDLYERNGALRQADMPFQFFRFNYVLNAPGAFEGDLQLNHALVTEANLDVGNTEIRVKRDGTLVWGGFLWGMGFSLRGQYRVRVRGEGYFSALRRRIIHDNLNKVDKDSGLLAWELVDYAQADGTFSFTDQHQLSGTLIDRTYCADDRLTIGDAITELTGMDDAFDVWITPSLTDSTNKEFHTYPVRRGTDLSGSISFNQNNAMLVDYDIDGSTIVNRLWGTGAGECNPAEFEATAGASITNYGELHGVVDFEDLNSFPSVKAHTREQLRLLKTPRRQATVRMSELEFSWGSFEIGDVVDLTSNLGIATGSRDMRVIGVDVQCEPANTISMYTVTLDSVVS